MNIKLMNGHVLDMLKNIHDESVDCVVSSCPYYGLRDYSGVATYSSEDYDDLLVIANTDLQKHRDPVPESQKDRYYLTEPAFNENDKKWYISLKYDTSGVWGGNPECEHDFSILAQGGLLHENRNGIGSTVLANIDRREKVHGKGMAMNSTCSKCGAWKGQLGLEPTYQMYIDHLMLVMKELKRVLKKTGTLFWNMGDSYASSGGASRHFGYSDPKWAKARNGSFEEPTAYDQGIKPKSLMMIPERFAMAMIDDGWILRNTLCWLKRNAMPSSVKDRFSNKWEYVFFFTKAQKYYFDLDSIRKPLEESSMKRITQENVPNQFQKGKSVDFAETKPVNNIPKILNNMHQKYQQEGAYKGSHSGYFNEDGSLRANLSGANPGDVIYNSKYANGEYGQTLQGFTRNHTIEKAREQSYIDAKRLYPDDTQKQKEYIKNIHDHLGNPNGANPGDVIVPEEKPYAIAERDKDYVEYRNLPPLEEVSEFLNKYRKELGYTIDQIEDKMNSQAPHHWFNAESYPSVEDWKKIKDILMFPDTYDKAMTEVFLKPSEKQNDPNGANPGDVNQDDTLYDLFTDPNIQNAFIDYLESERPELLMPTILDIPTMSHSFNHFAVFPETLVNPLIKAGCPYEVCVKCGKPKQPFFTDTGRYYVHDRNGEYADDKYVEYHAKEKKRKIVDATGVSDSSVFNTDLIKERVTKWIPSCNCNAGFEPGTVLDPFAGSGTVGVVAMKQEKNAILVEISPEYCNIIKKRLNWGRGLGVEYEHVVGEALK